MFTSFEQSYTSISRIWSVSDNIECPLLAVSSISLDRAIPVLIVLSVLNGWFADCELLNGIYMILIVFIRSKCFLCNRTDKPGGGTAKDVAQTVASFITTTDTIKMGMTAVDEVS